MSNKYTPRKQGPQAETESDRPATDTVEALALTGAIIFGLHKAMRAAGPTISSLVNLAAPHVATLKQIDWVNVKLQMERLPARSKEALKLPSRRYGRVNSVYHAASLRP